MSAAETWLEELSYEDCLALLRQGAVGRVATVVDKFPIVLPVNYRMAEIDSIDPSQHQGWSVLVRGTLQHVDPDAAGFRARFDPEPWMTAERDAWLVIEPFSITGRRLHAAEREWPFLSTAYL